MRIVCTGPISSGTRLLTDIVKTMCPDDEVLHRSMPQWSDFWDWEPDTLYIIIIRRPDISVKSAYRQGHGNPYLRGWGHLDHRMSEDELAEWWWRAMSKLACIPHAYWMSYEALVACPEVQIADLALWLGREVELDELPNIYDGNKKWR